MEEKKKKFEKKKAYTPPSVESKDVFEVNALGCAKCPAFGAENFPPQCIRGVKKFS